MADRQQITQLEALERLLTYLRSALSLNARQCFVCVNPLGEGVEHIIGSAGGERFVSVSPGPGEFPFGETIPQQCYEAGTATITGYVRLAQDNAGRENSLLLSTRGVLEMKRDILRAITGVDLDSNEGLKFLREHLAPVRSTAGDYDPKRNIGWVQITVPLEFDWDLSDE